MATHDQPRGSSEDVAHIVAAAPPPPEWHPDKLEELRRLFAPLVRADVDPAA